MEYLFHFINLYHDAHRSVNLSDLIEPASLSSIRNIATRQMDRTVVDAPRDQVSQERPHGP